ncbi:hypothetical protein OHA72_44220 [Dactylosporangium sp. NBC_01737]|jgi:hypothetical protein|nr:hypothetical protein OHA72_44220 [Dactylosporangium sp. NBC_01737]
MERRMLLGVKQRAERLAREGRGDPGAEAETRTPRTKETVS